MLLRLLTLPGFNRARMSHLALIGTLFVTVAMAGVAIRVLRQSPPTWSALFQEIRQTFPTVQHISTGELAEWLDSDRPPIVLDIRELEEFNVSQIEGAVLATTLEDALGILQDIPRDRPVVVYCSVGYRSSAVASELRNAGFTEVYNLEGSIFAWANEGRRVVRDFEPVRQVHPFNRKWGQLLERRLRSNESF